jgi:hypothetical protein
MSDEQEGRVVEPEGPGTAIREVQVNPLQMIQSAVSRGATLEYVRQLMDLQERWEANEAKKAFNVALAAFKADPPTLRKTKHVNYQPRGGGPPVDYWHASLDDACEVIGGAIARHGLSHRWDMKQEGERITVTCILQHEMGHSERVSLAASPDTTGSKNPIQALSSATTYLERYTFLAVTGMAAKGQDDDGQAAAKTAPRISEEQVANIEALLSETGKTRASFLIWIKRAYKADGIEDLAEAVYQDVVRELEARRREVSDG